MDASHVGLRRMAHLRIHEAVFDHPAQVAAWLGAMQGQDHPGTKWALGLRVRGGTLPQIDAAFAERSIMRVWGPRGTLHVVAAADVHWMVGLIAGGQIAGNARRYRELALDEPTLARSLDLIGSALSAGEQLTRGELLAHIERAGIPTTGQRGFYMLQRAGLERILAQGDMRGAETTYFALPLDAERPRDEALAELARRYFRSRGPAALADFAHWSGLSAADARAGLAAVRPELVEERIGGETYWCAGDTPTAVVRDTALLPGFDEFYLGYRDRSAVLDLAYANAVCPGGNGIFMPTLVHHGRIVGTWKRAAKKKSVEITLTPFDVLPPDAFEGIQAEAERYGAFLGLNAIVSR